MLAPRLATLRGWLNRHSLQERIIVSQFRLMLSYKCNFAFPIRYIFHPLNSHSVSLDSVHSTHLGGVWSGLLLQSQIQSVSVFFSTRIKSPSCKHNHFSTDHQSELLSVKNILRFITLLSGTMKLHDIRRLNDKVLKQWHQ